MEDFKSDLFNPLDFNISQEFGFILENPLQRLPPYFDHWNTIIQNLEQYLTKRTLRLHVDKLEVLDQDKLDSYEELRCAHLFLSLISHGYVWQEGDLDAVQVLPKQVAMPFCAISQRLGIRPVLCHASFVLANWRRIDGKRPLQLGNIETIGHMKNHKASDWFCMVTWQIEKDFAEAIQAIVKTLKCIMEHDKEQMCEHLTVISNVLDKMRETLARMHENLTADEFYNELRPFLSGWGGASSPLPEGLIYEGVSSDPVKIPGGSAAQSSIFHCLDAALGVKHKSDEGDFLKSMQMVMPPEHVKFIEALYNGPSIRTYVSKSEHSKLTETYNGCVSAMQRFRSYHIQIVTKYIVTVSSKTKKHKSLENTGTGGTSIVPFLKCIRDATTDTKLSTVDQKHQGRIQEEGHRGHDPS